MTTIGNVDLVMATLRARLQRLAKDKRAGPAGKAATTSRSEPRASGEALANLQQLPPEEFDRALVRAMLEGELGAGLADDPRFQALVERTAAVLAGDPETHAMLRRVQQEQA